VVSSSGSNLPRQPKRSAAIAIKRPDGEIVDVANVVKSASPAPSTRTPPVASSTATPPTKPSTPAEVRTESAAPVRSRQEIQEELRSKIAEAARGGAPKDDEAEKVKAEKEKADKEKADKERADKEKADAEEKAKAEEAEKVRKEAEEKAKADAEAEAAAAAEKKAAEEKAEAEQKAKADAEAKEKAEAEEKAKKDAEAEPKKVAAKDPSEMTPEELDAMFEEMEAEEKKREAEEAERLKARDAAKAAEKAKDAPRLAAEAAENDRKLREQEREMERLEDEKERKAKAKAAGAAEDSKDAESAKVDSVTEKMANVSIGGDSKPPTPTSATGAAKQRKPVPLNLSVNTKPVEPPQPSAALQALKTSRFLTIQEAHNPGTYAGTSIASPNPAVNAAANKRGQAFKYDSSFLLQFKNVFTEQPSTEFQSQVKALIGDSDGSRSASARTPATAGGRQSSKSGANFSNNAFGQFRTLPPGTTSAERMAMSTGAMARPPMGSHGSFRGPGGAFPGSNLMSSSGRQISGSGMGPNSPRQGSRPGRSSSHRPGYNPGKEAQAAKTMPLTQGQDLKPIVVSASGWKPTSIGGKPGQAASTHLEPDMVQRKVKAALNKMTPENFDKISDQILTIANQSKNENDGRTLRQVIQLTFEKATDEPHFSSTYAKFCKRMLDQMSPEIKDDTIKDKHGQVVNGGNLFRKYLLNRCQEEYEKGWSEPALAGDTGKAPGAELLSDEYYVAAARKRRGLGLVRFIGELFKLGMLTERIIHGCVHGLVDYKDEPKEAEIESLTFLLRTVGAALDASEKGRPMMDAYFQRIQIMVALPDLENRLKFMLMDVVDLRKDGWRGAEMNKGPKTLDEIKAEADRAAAAKAAEAARNPRGGPRPQAGRGDARQFSSGYGQAANNMVANDDLKRLKSTNRMPSGNLTLGPHSMLASRSNSGRRPGGPGGALGRSGDTSGMTSRTGTPPTRESSNAFG
jgi:translation initiation factor 4G